MSQRLRTSVLDPVDVVTGESYIERIDFRLPGPIELEWKAYYSSQFSFDGPIGRNWTHTYHQYLYFTGETVAYVDGQSSPTVFLKVPEVEGEEPSGDGSVTLRRDTDDLFSIVLRGNITAVFFRPSGSDRARLESLTDLNGRRMAFSYNKASRLAEVADSAGRTLHLSLDDRGRIRSVLCSREGSSRLKVVEYHYDGMGNLTRVEDAEGHSYRYEYDDKHQLVKRTDRNGYSFHYRYSKGGVVKTWGDDGLYTGEFLYDPENKQTTLTGFDGRKIQYLYDDGRRVTEEIDPYGRSSLTQFDGGGNLVLKTDRCDRSTVFAFDERGNKTAEVQPTGEVSSFTYNELNLVTDAETPECVTHRTYDERGNLLREEIEGGPVTVNRFDERGDMVFTRTTGSMPENNEYDEWHQLVSISDPFGNVTHRYEYDLLGNVTGIWDKAGWIRYGYDKMSRLVSAHYPDRTSEKSTFDAEGSATSFTDKLGRTWEYKQGSYKQLLEVVAPDKGSSKYEYTKADELAAVTDANDCRTEYERDQCDYVAAVCINGKLLETYERDGEGRLLAKKDRDGEEFVRLTFDLLDVPLTRVVKKAGAEEELSYEYGGSGAVLKGANGEEEFERVYDEDGHMLSETTGGLGVDHTYDEQGRLVATSFGEDVTFSVKYHGDVTAVRDASGRWHEWRIGADGVLGRTLTNGIEESFAYDPEGRITHREIAWTRNGNGRGSRETYEYDAVGQLTRISGASGSRLHQYDSCGRLTKIKGDEQGPLAREIESYTYDPGGNLKTGPNGGHAVYDPGNRLARWGEAAVYP